ncbi:MAG: MoaD/ThiS family protein [Pirellulales bacterium]|nr:MoaD/ThiS family protein [Pirellulales bacterium]
MSATSHSARSELRITVELLAQLRHAGGADSLQLALAPPSSLPQALDALAASAADSLRNIVFTDDRKIRPSVIVLVNGEIVAAAENRSLDDGDIITIMTPIGGG